jgi:hypothetical protein
VDETEGHAAAREATEAGQAEGEEGREEEGDEEAEVIGDSMTAYDKCAECPLSEACREAFGQLGFPPCRSSAKKDGPKKKAKKR